MTPPVIPEVDEGFVASAGKRSKPVPAGHSRRPFRQGEGHFHESLRG